MPLQDTDFACKELSRAMRAGHLGVQIGNHVGDRDLDDEGIVTFLQHCAAEGAAVLVHPWDMMGGERTARWMMGWTVSMPAETQLSIVALILGGGFDRLPASLRICFARGKSAFAPSHYLDRFYVDNAVFDPRALRLLVEVMGEDRVMLGSDYPFPLGEQRVGRLVRDIQGLGDGARAKLLAGNARRFLELA